MDIENLDEKLSTVKTNPDTQSHLIPDEDSCIRCEEKSCIYVCPASVYKWNTEEKKLIVSYENCLECGACRIACDKQMLVWKYPNASFGITYKQG